MVKSKVDKFYNMFFFILIFSLVIFMFFSYAFPYFDQKKDNITFNNQNIVVLVIFVALILGVLYVFIKYFSNRKNIVLGLITVSALVKIIWSYNFPLSNYFDMTSATVYAMDIMTIPNVLPLQGFHYLTVYDYNIPIVMLNVLYMSLFGISNVLLAGRIVNIICLIFIDIGIYFLSKEIFGRKVASIALFVSVLFFPFTGMVGLVYNDVNSCCMLLYSVYFFVKYTRYDKKLFLLFSIIFLLLGNMLRSVGLIFAIAFTLYLLYRNYRKGIIIACLFGASFSALNLIQLKSYEMFNIIDVKNTSIGVPITHYLSIGASKQTDTHSPGYYLPYLNDYVFANNKEYNKDEYNKIATNQLVKNLDDMGFDGSIIHYLSKYFYQWTDGTFETGLINNLVNNKEDSPIQFEYGTDLNYFITSKVVGSVITRYANSYWFSMLLLISIGIILSIKNKNDKIKEYTLLKLIIMGIMAFYVVWEISPHYSFVVLPYFVVLCGYYGNIIVERIGKND